ncbi:GNAT family N-acetyltransferase [Stenotrophomonas mori]|uniref:GNAT family N-acetyltransferase n=1 Tax=Stenotrophomonas mori TaxID=2871096 RepID=A0ABT0SEX3_9GAMM|nr:GNAT family N-acetyltransferase [Stenotrophomonas mori]MCL7713599.1 GNAT family N-acetyltransferase [Stenotrophomonas mori]
MTTAFRVEQADYGERQALLHGVRHAVFVAEQQVPPELEVDALDPLSHHVLALDALGRAIGAGRLTPQRRIGRMAVLPDWRGRGVGEALLLALLARADQLGWTDITLHAQVHARDFYVRHGFLPEGEPFDEAGIAHQSMRRRCGDALPVHGQEAAAAAIAAVLYRARRLVLIGGRGSDLAGFAQPSVLAALRAFAGRRHPKQVRLLLHDGDLAALPAALLALVQRLPSVFQVRQPLEGAEPPPSVASVANDNDDGCCVPAGDALQGELWLQAAARARRQDALFQRGWDNALECEGLRTLGL